MAPQSLERGQQDEFSAPWPQHSQLQLSSGDSFGTFSGLGSDPFADAAFSGYNTTISEAHRQYSPTLNLAHLTSSGYVATDTAAHPVLRPLQSRNDIKKPGLINILNGSDGPSTAPGSSSATTTTTTETHHDTSLGAPPTLYAPTIPTAQRRSRARKPASGEWERHKRIIEHLYLKQNLSLAETMTEMGATYQFYATEKMYKDMFKQWKWSKNLPRDIAIAMLDKAKRRQPKQTIFQWNNQTWTEDRIKKTHGKFVDRQGPNSLTDHPTPQGVTCETPRVIENRNSQNAPEETRELDRGYGPADRVTTYAPRSVGGPIDEGPFYLTLNQSSTADLSSFVKAALEAEKNGNEEEAEWGLRDALSCSSRLLSPIHAETVEIGYKLASLYATKRRFADAYDILNWITNKHLGILGALSSKTLEHLFHNISLLHHWLRNEEAALLTYRLLESLKNSQGYAVIPQISTEHVTVSKDMIGELLASSDDHTLAIFLLALQGLADNSYNHKFLQDLMPQIIERCDDFQQTHSHLAIQSRCILAEILVDGAQYERARSILEGSGRALKHQVDSKTLLEAPMLELVQRIAITFLRADDSERCDKVIQRVVAVFDTDYVAGRNLSSHITLLDFLLCTTFDMQKNCDWERIRPWAERALSLSYLAFGRQHSQTKRIENMIETHNVEKLFLMKYMRNFYDYLENKPPSFMYAN